MDPFGYNPFGQSSNTNNNFAESLNGNNYQADPFTYNPFGQSSNTNNYFSESSNTNNYQTDSFTYDPFGQSSNTNNFVNKFSSNAYNYQAELSYTFNPYAESCNIFNPFTVSEEENVTKNEEGAEEGEDEEGDQEESDDSLLEWKAVCTAAAYTLVYYYKTYVHKQPCHTSVRTGAKLIDEILRGNETRCYQDFRMTKKIFVTFCRTLVESYGLVRTQGMSEYEEVGMFLMTVAHGSGNRLMQEMWNHSGETISRHFHSVLKAICRLASDIIKPTHNYNAGAGYHTPQHARYHPYFEVSYI